MPGTQDVLPLNGIRVLELSHGWAAPLCGKLLVDLGADVVKLAPGGDDVVDGLGDEASYARHMIDAGKRVLPLAEQSDMEIAALVARADVVMGDRQILDRLHVSEQVDAATVVCAISPFGSTGPLSEHVASDFTLQAASAIMATTGERGGGPIRAGTELGASVAAMYGCIGVISALIERLRSSQGQFVEVSTYDCLVSTLTQFASRVLAGVPPLARLGNQGANSAPWNLFESGDEQYVFIIAGSDPTFDRLAKLMGREDLLVDPRFDTHIHRRENREEITTIVQAWCAEHTADDIVSGLRDAGVPVSLVATPAQVLEDAHFRSRGLLGSVEVEGQSWPVPGTPIAIGRHWGAGAAATPLDVQSWLDGPAAVAREGGEQPRQLPLAGMTVLDVGTITAGPFCARLLGNLGADVIKVEPPGGELGRHSPPLVEGESVYFHITNNGKRSVCLDLGTPEGQAHLKRLAGTADVLVENLAPGALTKRGLGGRDLTAVNPRLVYTSVSGFGHEGANGGQRAYDTVVQAAGGMMGITGEAGGKPLKTGISSADVLGAIGGTAATLAALYGRDRAVADGKGGWLDVAMYDVVAWATQMWWPSVFGGRAEVERAGNRHRLFAPYGAFDTADGLVALSCETAGQWRALVGVLQQGGIPVPDGWAELDRAGRLSRRDEIDDLLMKHCAGASRAALVAACQQAGVPAEPVLECAEVIEAPHTQARDLLATVERPGHPAIRVTNFPLKLSATPAGVRAPAPMVDEQGPEIREESTP